MENEIQSNPVSEVQSSPVVESISNNQNKTFIQKWLNGRLSRIDFLFGQIILGILVGVVTGLMSYVFKDVVYWVFFFVITISSIFLEFGMFIRRAHDFNKGIGIAILYSVFYVITSIGSFLSNALPLFAIVVFPFVIVALILSVIMIFAKDKNSNKYGEVATSGMRLKKVIFNDLLKK